MWWISHLGATLPNTFYGIEVNGMILDASPAADYDLMADSPTQNFATLNPLNTVSGSDNGIAATPTYKTKTPMAIRLLPGLGLSVSPGKFITLKLPDLNRTVR